MCGHMIDGRDLKLFNMLIIRFTLNVPYNDTNDLRSSGIRKEVFIIYICNYLFQKQHSRLIDAI